MDDDSEMSADLKLADVPKSTQMQNLKWEKAYLGMYVTGHPLRGLGNYISRKANLIGKLTPKQIGKNVKIVGAVTELRKVMTKAGKYMATFTIEDPSGRVKAVMFPRQYEAYGAKIEEDGVVGFTGKLDNKRGEVQIMCDAAKLLSIETMIENAKESGIYTPNDKSDIAVRSLDDIWADKEAKIEDEAETDKDTFLIEIPSGLDQAVMKDLKDLLLSHPGPTETELYLTSVEKRIKLPIQIDLTEKLKHEIQKLLKIA